MQSDFVVWLEQLRVSDIPKVGGKNASLGELTGALRLRGVRVPAGFATTVQAYREFIRHNGFGDELRSRIAAIESGDESLQEAAGRIREMFLNGEFPAAVSESILASYAVLSEKLKVANPPVAVRSSATAEDLPNASFAGQQETYLNVRGPVQLLDACKRCFASLYTDRAISYRDAQGIDQVAVAVSAGVQQMVRADIGSSGVAFSIDTETGFPKAVVVSANWGLGETVVQGSVNPDKYSAFKPLLTAADKVPIIEKTRGSKERKLVYGAAGGTELVETSEEERSSFVLDDQEILTIARWAAAIEDHYRVPMDLEWAKDGLSREIFIVQARPETVQSRRSATLLRSYHLERSGAVLLRGAAVGEAVASGTVCLIRTPVDIERFRDGAILVAEATDPDWVPVMRRAAGIITDHGGATSHAAIVSRELGVPAIVGTLSATSNLTDGQPITISCAEGEGGVVYEGILPFRIEETDIDTLPETRTELMVNSADPARAFRWWRLPAKGVGLARMEFIINGLIKVHPMALAHPDLVQDPAASKEIERLASAFPDLESFFVETLATGIAKLAAPYFPHPAIVRLSDFKTNEYAHLLGGSGFEPKEENPMLGFRGASRYCDARYSDGFALECRALKRARELLGFSNIIIMIPFCRTLEEADRVLAAMADHGLKRGEQGLLVYMMCEIPSNVILAREFARKFDGFSIGSNDLTQLILGVDRDSPELAPLFNECDPAVKEMIAEVIETARDAGIKIGICGQAPSNHPDFAAFLVEHAIDSISLNPDSFIATLRHVAEAERSGRQRNVGEPCLAWT